jgi:hypothetical protein
MKQQWRILQIRGIWGLFYGVLVLAGLYVGYVPIFNEMGSLGPLAFAGLILFVFLVLGYIYDRVLVMWAASQEVTQERNPFMYVPSPKDQIFWFPIYSTMLDALERLAKEYDLDTTEIKETRDYYSEIQRMRPERRQDIEAAIKLRNQYFREHPFVKKSEEEGT